MRRNAGTDDRRRHESKKCRLFILTSIFCAHSRRSLPPLTAAHYRTHPHTPAHFRTLPHSAILKIEYYHIKWSVTFSIARSHEEVTKFMGRSGEKMLHIDWFNFGTCQEFSHKCGITSSWSFNTEICWKYGLCCAAYFPSLMYKRICKTVCLFFTVTKYYISIVLWWRDSSLHTLAACVTTEHWSQHHLDVPPLLFVLFTHLFGAYT